MRRMSALRGSLAVGTVTLMLLLSAACEPPLPTAERQALPTSTATPLAGAVTPAATPPTTTATPVPTKEAEKEEKETVVPTLPDANIVIVEPDAEKAVAAAKADFMGRLGVGEEAILVKSVEEVQWPDSSLGCPQPGRMYLQVITPGFRVVLMANDQDYEYHTSFTHVVLCSSRLP